MPSEMHFVVFAYAMGFQTTVLKALTSIKAHK